MNNYISQKITERGFIIMENQTQTEQQDLRQNSNPTFFVSFFNERNSKPITIKENQTIGEALKENGFNLSFTDTKGEGELSVHNSQNGDTINMNELTSSHSGMSLLLSRNYQQGNK